MNYCPGCQEPLEGNEEECPYCGYELIATKKEEDAAEFSSIASNRKPFYKRGVFIAPLLILILFGILAGTGYAGYKWYQQKLQSDFKKDLAAIWLEVTNRSDQITSSLQEINKPADLQLFKEDLSSFSEFLANKQTEAVNLDPPKEYQANRSDLIDSIEKYNKYVYLLKLILQKDVKEVTTQDYSKIKKLSEEAQGSTDEFVAEAAFINDKLPQDLFAAINKITPLIEEAQKQLAEQEKQSLEQTQIAERREAEQSVRLFMQGKIDKNAAEMRRYITPEYDKVFDPEQEFAVTDTYPIDFKITKTESKGAEGYEINGDEIGKDLTGAKYTNKWWFKVIKFEGSWLIDNRKLLTQ